ncbi:protein of unknown function [Candidatus Nitrosocosmicus franklandus]|uniref:Uncharacterized protein n=1 Tax=Candidatus Nitrosocosmicus franklandianus TaxID=1798806 RepID=A0A484IBC1_9ARCH|nr:protein of unknown function [Candidatus Nitrosocosmicus franklandus]
MREFRNQVLPYSKYPRTERLECYYLSVTFIVISLNNILIVLVNLLIQSLLFLPVSKLVSSGSFYIRI